MFVVRFNWRRLFVAWLALLPLLSSPGAEKPRSLYDGATVMFDQAALIKPREHTNFSRAFTLAPLIIQEVRGGKSPATPTSVHFQSGTVQLNGLSHEQMTYWWFYNEPKPAERRPPARRGPDVRPPKRLVSETNAAFLGIRLTLNTNGVPVICEVLESSDGIGQIFVTQSIEADALVEFGPALPGRRHAVERSLNDAPGIVVPRVLDDPPDIMGPILYLRAGTHAVATMICRCMASQAREVAGSSYYELKPAEPPAAFPAPAGRLDVALRLPTAARR